MEIMKSAMCILTGLFKKVLTEQQVKALRDNKALTDIAGFLFSYDICSLGRIYNPPWLVDHPYASRYREHFRKIRRKRLNILTIGIGGYADTGKGGASLRMWKKYFPKSMIYGIDIFDKSRTEEKRIKTFKGSQSDEGFLKDVCAKTGPLDIVIDDGSHVCGDSIVSFKALFPFLKSGGVYVVEDLQTSYWPRYGGDSDNLNDPATSISFFKSLADGLNYREFLKPDYEGSYFDKNIVSIHFYNNLVFIYKGENNEHSNMIMNGRFKPEYEAAA